MKTFRPLLVLAAFAAVTAHGQVSYVGGPYSQDFNGLGTNSQAWTQGSTLPGWSAFTNVADLGSALTQLPIISGQIANAALNSAPADRALGAARLNGTPSPTFGLALVNNSGSTISSFTLSYVGKEFGFISSEKLTFSYGLGSANLTSGGFVDVPSLSFGGVVPPFLGGGDGFYLATNVAGSVNLSWQDGQILWLRWTATNTAFSGGVLAVDSLNFSTVTVPEPASFAALATVLGGSLSLRRRRNRA